VAIGLGLSVVLSPHLGDYSLMLLAIPVAVLAPRAPALILGLAAAYTAASLWNPLVPLNESAVAMVLLAGSVAVVWRATHPATGDFALHLPTRSAAGVSSA
jgi:membrane protein implicated in regulation of membrane protease activity